MKHPTLHGLYAITDNLLFAGRDIGDCVEPALRGGTRIVQYRDKSHDTAKRLREALVLRELCSHYQALLIINDDVALTKRVGADGVHLGIDDTDISEARAQLGDDAIIGMSCYNRFELAERAIQQNADYIAFGTFYPSPTKPDAVKAELELLTRAQQLNIPLCAIGGITPDNGAALLNAGADMLAVINAMFAHDDIHAQAQRFAKLPWQSPRST